MKLENLQEKLENYKSGTYVNVEWSREVSNAKCKKSGLTVIKNCNGVVRAAINYNNLKAVKALQDTNFENNKTSWFEHFSRGLVQNKQDTSKKYLQLFTTNNHKINSSYIVLDAENKICMFNRTPEELYEMGMINKSELSSADKLATFTLNVENIVKFGGNV